jgi:LuxR family maltose regulon positive regulatory protein
MRGNIDRAIELCLAARENIPASNLALQFDTLVTLGYEYFLRGDYANASQILNEAIRSGVTAGAIIHTVAASCFMARLYAIQGLLNKSYDTYRMAAQLIPEGSGHLDAKALVEAGIADVLCEWNDLDAALVHLQQGLNLLPMWGKADDLALAYVTLARIHLAQSNTGEATRAVEEAIQLIQTSGVFPEARTTVEIAQVRLWLAQGDLQAASRWAASQEECLSLDDGVRFENELTHITQARVLLAQNRPEEASNLLSHLEESARSAERMGRVIEILLLQALALRKMGDSEGAILTLTKCLTLAEPEGYVRIFLDEGQAVQLLLAQWLAHASGGPLRGYAVRLLSHFDAEPKVVSAAREEGSPGGAPSVKSLAGPGMNSGRGLVEPEVRPAEDILVEPLSQRELEVLHLIALGRTNKEIARQLIIAPGTVKAHTSHIYGKLNVANRTAAVARARQLGILP